VLVPGKRSNGASPPTRHQGIAAGAVSSRRRLRLAAQGIALFFLLLTTWLLVDDSARGRSSTAC
jgi:hypothetical protein